MESMSPIIEFLGHVKSKREEKAAELLDSVKTEIEQLKKMKLDSNGKNAINLLKNMIRLIESKKFSEAFKDHVKIKNGLEKIIKKRLKDVQEVEGLTDNVGKVKKPGSTKTKSRTTSADVKKNKSVPVTENSHHQHDAALSVEGQAQQPRPRSSVRDVKTKQAQVESKTASKTKTTETTDNPAYNTQDKTNIDSKIPDHESESNQKQVQESKKNDLKKSINIDIDIMRENDPKVVKDMFKSLHDNEWVDAHDVLQQLSLTDKHITKRLLDIVQIAYTFCHKEAEHELQEILQSLKCLVKSGSSDKMNKNGVGNTDMSGDINMVKKFRLLHVGYVLDMLYMIFIEQNKGRIQIDSRIWKDAEFVSYVKKCVHVTWLMCVQDPPTSLHPTDLIIPGMYKPPPRGNWDIDYITWPALIQGGRLLDMGEVKYRSVK